MYKNIVFFAVSALTINLYVAASETKPLINKVENNHQEIIKTMKASGSQLSDAHLNQFLNHLKINDQDQYRQLVQNSGSAAAPLTRSKKSSHATASRPKQDSLADLEEGVEKVGEQLLGQAAQFGYNQLAKEHQDLQSSHRKSKCAAVGGGVLTLLMGGMNLYCKSSK